MNIHLGASGILYRDGHILLGQRSSLDQSLPGQWCTPGGGIEPLETINEAIRRVETLYCVNNFTTTEMTKELSRNFVLNDSPGLPT